MKDRNFSTKKLAESIKVLRKASGVNVKEFCKSCILWWKIMAIAEWTRR